MIYILSQRISTYLNVRSISTLVFYIVFNQVFPVSLIYVLFIPISTLRKNIYYAYQLNRISDFSVYYKKRFKVMLPSNFSDLSLCTTFENVS